MSDLSLALQVLQTKLHVPAVRPGRVVRARLLARLDEGLALGHHLFLVSAPAGFGKTTLVSDWLAHLAGRGPVGRVRPAWLTLDRRDNDPYRFWRYVLEALRGALPGLGETIRASLLSPTPAPIDVLVGEMINEASAQAGAQGPPVLLVIDDYHHIQSPEVSDSLAYFIEHLPEGCRLLIATRTAPTLPLARLRSRFLLSEVRETDLRFAPEETRRFLLETNGLQLGEPEVAALETRTEGWVAGLQLAALALRGALAEQAPGRVPAGRVADILGTFSGSHRFVLDYLTEEVLKHQPPEVVAFLTETSALDQISAELCEAVLADAPEGSPGGVAPGSQRLLDYLERSNLFIIPLDHQRRWYRYHSLFSGFLRARLVESAPGRARVLYRRAAAWYAGQGELDLAIDYALRGEDFQQAARLMERAVRAQVVLPRNWLAALPEAALRSRPLLCASRAMEIQIMGAESRESVQSWLEQAEQALEDPALDEDEDYRSVVRGHILLTRASQLNRGEAGDQPEQAVHLAAQALECFPEDEWPALSSAAVIMTHCYRMMDNLAAARESIRLVWKFARASGAFARIFVAGYIDFDLAFATGSLEDARAACLEALRLASESPGQRGLATPEAGAAYIGLAQVHLERGELAEAEEALNQGLRLIQVSGQMGIAIDGWLARVYLRCLQRDRAGAEEALGQLERSYPNHPLITQAIQAWIWLACLEDEPGLAGRLVEWVERNRLPRDFPGGLPAGKLLHHALYVPLVILIRVMVELHARGIPARRVEPLETLEGYLGEVIAAAGNAGRWGIANELLSLQALALDALGHRQRALEAVEEALARAAPQGQLFGFLAGGARMAGLLEEALRQGRQPAFAARALAACRGLAPAGLAEAQAAQPSSVEGWYEALSVRELEVLRLLAAGYSNREIAETLVLAEGTVKKHVSNILGKLGVDSRARAVLRARELRLGV
jgi:LuxR family maltose regulon positive regulatory protein